MPVQLNARTYVRRPFEVEAVGVTVDNMALVAAWCGGEVVTTGKRPYISVPVAHSTNEHQTKAFPSTYVVKADQGFRVYSQKSFFTNFIDKERLGVQEDDDYGRIVDEG